MRKLIPCTILVVLTISGVALAGGSDITGTWEGVSCCNSDPSGSCPPLDNVNDNQTTLTFASNPKSPPSGQFNTASYYYPQVVPPVTCRSHLVYESDFGGGIGAYHYWQFADEPQNGCCAGTVVVAVEDGSSRPMEAWWYANSGDDAGCFAGETTGFLTK